MEIRTFIW